MKKSLMSLLLVGALIAPSALQTIEATGTDTGGTGDMTVVEVENEFGGITKTITLADGTVTVQVLDAEGKVVGQDEAPAPKPAITQYVGDPSLPFLGKVVGEEVEGVITVRVGTDESWTKQIPFETIVRSVATQEFNTRTESGGELGSKTVTQRYQVDPETGQLYNASLLEDQITKEAVNKVISVGNVNIDNVEIPFETRYVVDTNLEKGKEDVLTKGIVGKKNVLTTYFINEDGTLGEVENVEEVMNFEPVTEVIAHNPAEDDLDSAKDLILKELAELNLSTQELELFTSGINEAETVDEVKKVLDSAKTVSEFNNNVIEGLVEKFPELKDGDYTYETVRKDNEITINVKDTEDNVVAVYVYDVTTEEYTEVNSTPPTREDLLGRGDDLITFETEEDAQAAIDALDEEDQEGLEVAETEDGLFYVAHVIPAMPLTPAVNTKTVIGAVKNDFPDYNKEDYTYETEVKEDIVLVTITDAEGEFVAVVEYDRGTQLTRVVSVPMTPLEPATPIEETTDEETTEEDEETTEDEESGAIVDEEESEVVAGQPIQVKRTDSVDSRANLPETGELGSGLTIMAAILAGLGGLGFLFKRRS